MRDRGGGRSVHLYLCRWLRGRHLQPDRDRYTTEKTVFLVLEKSSFIYHSTYRAINHAAHILLTLLPVALFSGPCSPNPCKNDGLCEVVTPTRRGDVFNEYICKCQPGFEGAHCQISKLLLDEQLRGNIKECVN